MKKYFFVVMLFSLLSSAGVFGQCHGYLAEDTRPPAVEGMSTDDPGFTVRYWSWGEYLVRRGGSNIDLVDVPGGILIEGLEWEAADTCSEPGEIQRTAVLFESLGPDGFGRFALVNIGGTDGDGADVDRLQADLGGISSRAAAIPVPSIDSVEILEDVIALDFSWQNVPETEALSDLVSGEGEPLPSVRGWALYIINGAAPTPRPWDWSYAPDSEEDAVSGFSTDLSAHIELPRSLWHDVSICFALAPTFDGNGDATGETPESVSPHSTYLGHPSEWLALPPESGGGLIDLNPVEISMVPPGTMAISFSIQNEPAGDSIVISLQSREGRTWILDSFDGGLGSYERDVRVPSWARPGLWSLVVTVLDRQQHVVFFRRIPWRRMPQKR